jgi:GTP-binding protein HflX
VTALIPYSRGDLINRIHQTGEFSSSEHTAAGTRVVARVNADLAAELDRYRLDSEA